MGLLNLLWKSDENTTSKPELKKTPVTPVTGIKNSTPTEFSESFNKSETPISGVRKQEIVDYFKKVFEENNIPGPDYQEFANALEEMKSKPMDEATKIKTLFLSFKAMKLTPQKLIETANQYKVLFKGKLTQFDNELTLAFQE